MPAFYVDIQFGINLLMNLFLLTAVKKACRILGGRCRILLAAAVGAAGSLALYSLKLLPWLSVPAGYFILPASMLMIAFKVQNIERGICYFITLYTTAFLAGGVLTFVFEQFTFSHSSISLNYHRIYEKYRVYLIGAAAVTALAVLFCAVHFCLYHLYREKGIVAAVFVIHGQRVEVRALVDTGNRLYEPISQSPVMVVEQAFIKQYFKKEDMLKIRAVPYHSVGKRSGILYAFPVEAMEIKALNLRREKVFVAFYDGTIGSGCHALLHPDMLR